MRLTVFHDRNGTITNLIACPSDAPFAQMEMRPGERVTEVDAPDADLGDTEAMARQLTDLIDNYQLEPEGSTGKLVRRD